MNKEVALLMGLGNKEPDRQLKAMKLQDLAKSGPAFVVSRGAKSGEAIDIFKQLHTLYRAEGKQMAETDAARENPHGERKAYLIAHSPKHQDVTMRFWKRDQPTPTAQQQFQKADRP